MPKIKAAEGAKAALALALSLALTLWHPGSLMSRLRGKVGSRRRGDVPRPACLPLYKVNTHPLLCPAGCGAFQCRMGLEPESRGLYSTGYSPAFSEASFFGELGCRCQSCLVPTVSFLFGSSTTAHLESTSRRYGGPLGWTAIG